MGNIFGHLFRVTTFGESHGGGVGVVIDGCPPKLEIDVKEISWQVAPSAVHAPFVTLFFFLKSLFSGKTLKKESVKNLKACFLIFFLGMCRSSIGYYKITAKK